MRKNSIMILLGCGIVYLLIFLSSCPLSQEPQIYSITFDTGEGSTVASQAVKENESVIRPTDPTRIGYSFDNWYSDEACVTEWSFDTPITADMTFYAAWVANTQTITFVVRTGSSPEPATKEVTYDQPYNSLATTTREGHTFAGWWTEVDGTGDMVTESTIFTGLTDQELYAHWTIETYRVTYNANEATSGEVPPEQTKEWGHNLTLAANSGLLTRIGYSFDGWNTQGDGSGTNYDESSSYYANEEVTLYANWKANTQTIRFNANSESSNDPPNRTATYNQPYGELRTPYRHGYTFAGWWTEVDGDGDMVTESTIFTGLTDQELYAHWTINTYLVTYEANGATSGTIPSMQIKTYGEDLTLAQNTGNLQRTNHSFVGWNTIADGSGTDYEVESAYSNNNEVTLYANWVFNVFSGLAGGTVFYENPNWESESWRYLEAAPDGWYGGASDPRFQWGLTGDHTDLINTEAAIGTGKSNTENIVSYHNSLGNYYTNPTAHNGNSNGTVAAKMCTDYFVMKNGKRYDDWFLPSQQELYQVFHNMKDQGFGEFSDDKYWSSTIPTSIVKNYVYFNDFTTGNMHGSTHSLMDFLVRPIRAYE